MEKIRFLKPQEIPLDHPDSCYMFQPSAEKPLTATPAAVAQYSLDVIVARWKILQLLAKQHQGLDYLQVFEAENQSEDLWFIEDDDGGAITAMLPSDY
jgi:hypothetical protein